MSDLIEIKKGVRLVAGGTAKVFEVQKVSKGVATLEEDVKATRAAKDEQPEPEVITASVQRIIESDDWKGAED